MKFWEVLDNEEEAIREKMDEGPLAERTWDCDPLLVIDDSDDSIAFEGRTNVTVDPRADGTADSCSPRRTEMAGIQASWAQRSGSMVRASHTAERATACGAGASTGKEIFLRGTSTAPQMLTASNT